MGAERETEVGAESEVPTSAFKAIPVLTAFICCVSSVSSGSAL